MGRLCTIEGCERPHAANGLCKGHYQKRYRANAKQCSVVTPTGRCPKLAYACGLCNAHYCRDKRHGDVQASRPILKPRKVLGFIGAHSRARALWGSASSYDCIACEKKAEQWAYDGTDPEQLYGPSSTAHNGWSFYSQYPEFYMPMCRSCHVRRDRSKTQEELKEYRLWRHTTGLSLKDVTISA